MKENKKCSICGSSNKVCNTEIGLLCGKHYCQFKRHGEIPTRTKYDRNEIKEHVDYAVMTLYNNHSEPIAETIIDFDDVERIKSIKWCLDKNGYVKNSKGTYLHRFLFEETNLYVDHINGNTLDNRKENLRLCTNTDNLKNRVNIPSNNRSGILGVRYRADRHKWYAEIQANNVSHYLGCYIKLEDAINARKNAEIKYFGEYKSKILNYEVN